MANAILGYDNVLARSGTVLSESTSLTSLPVSNLADSRLSNIWRSSTNSITIQITAPSSTAVDAIALAGFNGTGATTIAIRASDVQLGDSEVLSVSSKSAKVDTVTAQLLEVLSITTTAQYWEINIEDTSIPRLEAGYLFHGPVAQPTTNIRYPLERPDIDNTQIEQTNGGQALLYTYPQQRVRRIVWQLENGEIGTDALFDVRRINGRSQPVLFSADHESANWARDTVLGFASLETRELASARMANFNVNEYEWTVTEAL